MNIIKEKSLALLTCLICSGVWSNSAQAHPHEWIEMQITAIFNDDGHITALRQNWLMDEFFSSYATEDIERVDGLPPQIKITKLGEEMLSNIKEINYFSNISHQAKIIKPGAARHINTTFEDLKLRMIFEMDLQAPIDPSLAPLVYRIYDPEFYIEMIHIEGDEPLSLEGAPKGCKWEVRPPQENQALMAYANSLGTNDKPNQELGAFFSENASIACGKATDLMSGEAISTTTPPIEKTQPEKEGFLSRIFGSWK